MIKSTLVSFPVLEHTVVNMMPIVMGDASTLPASVARYASMIDRCALRRGDVVYLTVHESFVWCGETQRRSGVHTDGTSVGGWGDGKWGGGVREGGIYLASTDGDCLLWDEEADVGEVDAQGALLRSPATAPIRARPGHLYHISDRTPHASVAASRAHYRQFFRLVGPDIHAWYARRNTPNPLGVLPLAPVIHS